MIQYNSLPLTFAGLPACDDGETTDADIAVIGVPYLSPYPLEKFHDSQNAAASIRRASLTYQKIDHYDFDFDGSLLAGIGDVPRTSSF